MRKTYVLDTNILLTDALAVHNFGEHNILIPFTVLQELDGKKVGHTDLNRNAREATRQLEEITKNEIDDNTYRINQLGGCLSFTTGENLVGPTNDDKIIEDTVNFAQLHHTLEVILVSSDLNMRVKAKTRGLKVESYKFEAFDDTNFIKDCYVKSEDVGISNDTANRLIQESNKKPSEMFIPANSLIEAGMLIDMLGTGIIYRVKRIENGTSVVIQNLIDYQYRNHVWNVRAKNVEQNIALNLLTDPDLHLVAIAGDAGSGKTMVTLAAALSTVMDEKLYDGIVVTRETIVASDSAELGFLPGTLDEKLSAYMGPFADNLRQLTKETNQPKGVKAAAIPENIANKIEYISIGLQRGRSIPQSFIIIDEAQNLTKNQMKMIISRAAVGSKIVLMGNLNQIDSPYISASSSGFTWVINKFRDWERFGCIILKESIRSELASEAIVRLK